MDLNEQKISEARKKALSHIKKYEYKEAGRILSVILAQNPEDTEALLTFACISLFIEQEPLAAQLLYSCSKKRIKEISFAKAALDFLSQNYEQAINNLINGWQESSVSKEDGLEIALDLLSYTLASAATEKLIEQKPIISSSDALIIGFINMLKEKNCFLGHKAELIAQTVKRMLQVSEQIPSEEAQDIIAASALCNLGMIFLPDNIFTKNEPLTQEEKELICKHPEATISLIKAFGYPESVIKIVRHHHDKYDGTGSLKHIKGKEIPLGSRIIAIAEFFTEITNESPRQTAVSVHLAINTIKTLCGSFFCPEAFELLQKVYGVHGT